MEKRSGRISREVQGNTLELIVDRFQLYSKLNVALNLRRNNIKAFLKPAIKT